MRKDWVSRELTIEVLVGAFVVMIFIGLAYFTIILSKEAWFGTKHIRDVYFEEVMGLREGDSVVVRGMPVGKVRELDLGKDCVRVVVALDEPVPLYDGYRITVTASSILGGRYLSIDPGATDGDLVPPGEQIRGEKPYDIVADAAELINAVKEGVVDGGIVDNLKQSSADLRDILARVSAGKGDLGKLLDEDETLYKDLAATAASLRKVSERIEKGEGLLGKMAQDDTLYDEVKGAVNDIRAAIDDVRETQPVVTFTSVFFGAF